MSTVVEMTTMQELEDHIRKMLSIFACEFRFSEITIAAYGHDSRTGWDTYVVTMPDYGVLGWTDGEPLTTR